MGDRRPRRLVLEHHLGLLIQTCALADVGCQLRLHDEILERLIAPEGTVRAARRRVATEQHGEEVIGVAVVAGPAKQHGLVLAILRALEVLGPIEGDKLGADADRPPVGLNHLSHAFGVRIVGPLHRHRPDVGVEAVGEPGSRQHPLGRVRIEGVVDDRVVVGPDGRRDRVLGGDTGALEHGLDNGGLVDRHVERLTHPGVVERRLARVIGEVADVQTFALHQVDVGIGAGNGMTWHSPACSLANRTEASGVIENTRLSSGERPR